MTTTGFAPTAAKELKVTSTGHASFATGKALSPVLSVALTFTPTKATKSACTKGSDTRYAGKVTGTLTLATGLKSVKVKVKFAATAGASLEVDKSCQPKVPATKNPCTGGSSGFDIPATTCYIGSKKYKETSTQYFGAVKVSKPFKASTLLAGTLTAKTPTQGFYTVVKLAAA